MSALARYMMLLGSGAGAVARAPRDRALDTVSIFDYMTRAQKADVRAGTRLVDTLDAHDRAIAAVVASNANGGKIIKPRGAYLLSNTVAVPFGVGFEGEGMQATIDYFTGAGDCYLLGSLVGTLNPGLFLRDMGIALETKTSTAVHLRAAVSAALDNLYLEGYTTVIDNTRTNKGVYIDGGNISSFFNQLSNIRCNHMHTGYRVSSSGTTGATQQVFVNCSSSGDKDAGDTLSVAYDFDTGYDSVIFGGNCENTYRGIWRRGTSAPQPTIVSYGMRYENNTIDLQIDGTGGGCKFIGSPQLDVNKVVDNSGSGRNWIEYGNGEQSRSWVPVDGSGAGLAIVDNGSAYTKNGNVVTAFFDVTYPATANGAQAQLAGLPFRSANDTLGGGVCHHVENYSAATAYTAEVVGDSYKININKNNVLASNAALTLHRLVGSVTYRSV